MGLCFRGKFRGLFRQFFVFRHLNLNAAAMKNHLPDRWTVYNPVGKRIPGTRFIAFKVPLKNSFDSKLHPRQRFSPTDLISEVEKQNEQLGLIVDLTCTKRYYSPQELPKSLQYNKIFTAGQQVPTNEVIHEFKSIVQRFINENSDNDKLIGVHCTHGLNRTGYLVCRYMIDMLGMVPSDAIERFNKSRGHCIERANYLQDLLHGKVRDYSSNSSLGPPSNYPKNHNPPVHQKNFPQTGGRPSGHQSYSNHPSNHYPPRHQRDFPQSGGRPPGHPAYNQWPAQSMPSAVFSKSTPRHHVPQMEEDIPHHFRNGPRPQHMRFYDDDWSVNETPEDFAFHIPHQNVQSSEFGSHRHEPYRRHRGQGQKSHSWSKKQWQ